MGEGNTRGEGGSGEICVKDKILGGLNGSVPPGLGARGRFARGFARFDHLCVHGSLIKGGIGLEVPLIKGELGGSDAEVLAKSNSFRSTETD
jgi:hypothetical protein